MSRDDYWVYILTNCGETVLYVGITNDLRRRVGEHREGEVEGFSKKYNLKKLVYAERFQRPKHAIRREKQLKNWKREWKEELIEEENPDFEDLYSTL